MTEKEYRTNPAVSRSDLWKINQSPLHFKYARENKEEPTRALIFGQAMHKALLEPETFSEEFAVAPNVDRRTKAGKEEYAAFIESSADKVVIPSDDLDQIFEMRKAVLDHPVASVLVNGSIHEKPFFWLDDMTGEACKCRPDIIADYDGKKWIVDYKTTSSCADGDFEHSVRKYGYKFQAGMYCEGVFQNTLEEHGFAFIAQEKTPPYAVRVYFCTPEFVAEGYDQFRKFIGIYHACNESGIWYGYEGPFNTTSRLIGEDEADD